MFMSYLLFAVIDGVGKLATKDQIANIFRYRGIGWSQQEVAELTGLSRQAVAYQLQKLKADSMERNIDDVISDNTGLVRLDSLSKGFELAKLLESRSTSEDVEFDPLADFDEKEKRACVVLDASNAIYRSIPSLDSELEQDIIISPTSLRKVIEAIESKGWVVKSAMKRATYVYAMEKGNLESSEKELLRSLVTSLKISLINSQNDDPWIIQCALDNNGWIVSNDRYADWKRRHSALALEIDSRRVPFVWVGDSPLMTGLPNMNTEGHKSIPQEVELKVVSNQNHTMAEELVLSMLSSGDWIQLSSIQSNMASTFIGLEGSSYHQTWPSDWASRLTKKMGEMGFKSKKFSDQMSELMGDRIEFQGIGEQTATRVRKR